MKNEEFLRMFAQQAGVIGQNIRGYYARQEQQAQQKQQRELKMIGMLNDLMGLTPGPGKDVALRLVKKQWDDYGSPLPDELWGAIRKGDEASVKGLQDMAESLAQSGIPMTPQALSTMLGKPDLLTGFLKFHGEAQKLKAQQAEQQAIAEIAGAGGPGGGGGQMPAGGPGMPMTQGGGGGDARLARIAQLQQQIQMATQSGRTGEALNRWVDNARAELSGLVSQHQFEAAQARQAQQLAQSLSMQRQSQALSQQRFAWERSPERLQQEMLKSQMQGLMAAQVAGQKPLDIKETSSLINEKAWREEGRVELAPVGITAAQAREGGYRYISDKQKEGLAATSTAKTLVGSLKELSDQIITAEEGGWDVWKQGIRLGAQTFTREEVPTVFAEAKAAYLGNLSRSLAAERGVLTDQDIKRIEKGLPGPFDTKKIAAAKWRIVNNLISTADAEAERQVFGDSKDRPSVRKRLDNLGSQMDEVLEAAPPPAMPPQPQPPRGADTLSERFGPPSGSVGQALEGIRGLLPGQAPAASAAPAPSAAAPAPSLGQRAWGIAQQMPLPGPSGIAGVIAPELQGRVEQLIGKEAAKALDAGALSALGTAAGGAVLGPVGAIAGSVAARKLNVLLDLENEGPIGDIASFVVPSLGFAIGPVLKVARKIPTNALLKGGVAGGFVQYLTGSTELMTVVATALGVGPVVVKMLQKGGAKQAAKWLINSQGAAKIGAVLGTMREAAQYYGVEAIEEPEPKTQKR